MRRCYSCLEMLGSCRKSNSSSFLSFLEVDSGLPGSDLSFLEVDSDISLLIAALKACSILRDTLNGVKLHSDAARGGLASNIYVANTLVVMYSKCGRMAAADQVFYGIQARSLVSWTALMLGYVENGRGELALELFQEMQRQGFSPNSRCFVAALKACSCLEAGGKLHKLQALEKAREIHSQAAKNGCELDVYVASTLIDLYAGFGVMRDAREVFEKMLDRNTVAWNALILGYAENSEPNLALELFHRMKSENFQPNARTFVAAFKACSRLAEEELGDRVEGGVLKVEILEKGRVLHTEAVESGWESDIFVPTALVEMYSKCGSLVDACRVFEQMPHHDVVPWNSMILGLAEAGKGKIAWELFTRMKSEALCEPNFLTLVAALKACGDLAASEFDAPEGVLKVETLEKVMIVHRQAERSACSSEVYLASSLVDLYAKCGSMLDARRVFDEMEAHDVICWTSLLLGYSETGDPMLAWEFFTYLLREACELDARIIVAALKACILLAEKEEAGDKLKLESLEKAMIVHAEAMRKGFDSDKFVASSLVATYSKCGNLLDARRAFDLMPGWDSVSWTSLILGLAELEEVELALEIVWETRQLGASNSILVAGLKACTGAGALELLKLIHGELCRAGLESDQLIAITSLESFGRCGGFLQAQQLFDCLPCRSVFSWNSLMMVYSRQGNADRVLRMIQEMKAEGFSPDSSSFIWILTACSHAGLVETGKRIFLAMSSGYGVAPGVEHYVCMADLLGRANELDAAVTMVNSMPFEPGTVAWISILAACCKWGNSEVGKLAFETFLRLEKNHAAPFALMANLCCAS